MKPRVKKLEKRLRFLDCISDGDFLRREIRKLLNIYLNKQDPEEVLILIKHATTCPKIINPLALIQKGLHSLSKGQSLESIIQTDFITYKHLSKKT